MAMDQADITKFKDLYIQTARAYVNDSLRNVGLLLDGTENEDAVKIVHMATHSLTSQSLLMGYSFIGTCASQIEKIFKSKMDGAHQIDHATIVLVDTILKKMATSIYEIET